MKRGEVWRALVGEKGQVVVLSMTGDVVRAIMVVPPAITPVEHLTVEVRLGAAEGLLVDGALRVALPRPGTIPCHWLVTLSREDLIERRGVLSSEKIQELEHALRLAALE